MEFVPHRAARRSATTMLERPGARPTRVQTISCSLLLRVGDARPAQASRFSGGAYSPTPLTSKPSYMHATYMHATYMRAIYIHATYIHVTYILVTYIQATYILATYIQATYIQ